MPQILSVLVQGPYAIIMGMDFFFTPNTVTICPTDNINDPLGTHPTIIEWTDDRIKVQGEFDDGTYWFVTDQNGMPNLDGFKLQMGNKNLPITGWTAIRVWTEPLEL